MEEDQNKEPKEETKPSEDVINEFIPQQWKHKKPALSLVPYSFNELDTYAESIANSTGVSKETKKEDIITAMVVGHEIGLNPITAAVIHRQLTPSNLAKAIRGKSFGLNFFESMDSFHVSKEGKIINSLSIAYTALEESNIEHEVIKDREPIYNYTVLNPDKNGMVITQDDYDLIPKDRIRMVSVADTEAGLKKYLQENPEHVILDRAVVDRVSSIKFTKPNSKEFIISFKYSEAKAAGLLDKSTWEKYYDQMAFSVIINRAARRFASKRMKGLYGDSEIEPVSQNTGQ